MIPFADKFVVPLINTNKSWYEATRRYGPYNYHPNRCEDWNLETGGNTDLGEPLCAPFSGLVLAASNYGGGVGRVIQLLGVTPGGEMIVWGGWHLHCINVLQGQVVHVGERIGAIGNADGRYAGAHLHEQICVVGPAGVPAPTTFASDSRYKWQMPSVFYVERGVDDDLIRRLAQYDGM